MENGGLTPRLYDPISYTATHTPWRRVAKGNPYLPSKLINDMNMKDFASRLHGEDGQVLSHVLSILLVAAVIGAIIFQFGPIIMNHISIGKLAGNAAEEGSIAYRNNHGDMDKVYEVIQEYIDAHDARLDGTISVEYDASGDPVKITVPVRRITNSWIFENIGYLSPYTEAKAFGESAVTR